MTEQVSGETRSVIASCAQVLRWGATTAYERRAWSSPEWTIGVRGQTRKGMQPNAPKCAVTIMENRAGYDMLSGDLPVVAPVQRTRFRKLSNCAEGAAFNRST